MKTAIENKHAIYCQDVLDITLPLRSINITYFHHVRTFNDGSRISLSNNKAWMLHYYKMRYYLQPAINKNLDNSQNHHFYIPNLENEIFNDLRQNFMVANCLTITEHSHNYTDFFYFGSTPENCNINEFYINNLNLFKRFILYYRDKASLLIKKTNNDRIIFPHFMKTLISSNPSEEKSHLTQKIEQFIQKTPISKYHIMGHDKLQFTQKDIDTLKLCLDGATSKEIANILKVSYRTVESRLEEIKIKLDCRTKIEVLKKLYSLITVT